MLKLFVGLSLLLHLSIFLLFHKSTAPEKEVVQIEFHEVVPPPPPPVVKRRSGGSGSNRKNGMNIPLGQLGPRPHYDLRALRGENLTDEGFSGLAENEWGSHGGKFGEIEFYSLYLRLFREIENMLNYPSRLGEHDISGTVNTRLVFDKNSQCDWKKTRIGNGAHVYLRYYILTLLKKLCSFETVEHLRFKENQFADLSFNFVLTTEFNHQAGFKEGIVSNILTFYRTHPRPKLQYNIGPIRGFFPFPAVTLDVGWLQEHWEKWVEHRNPLADFEGHGGDPNM